MHAQDVIKKLLKDTVLSVKESMHLIGADTGISTAPLVNQALSYISTIKAIYWSDYEHLENQTLDDILEKFDEFESEFFSSYATVHSMQWTLIHANEFIELTEPFASS